MSTSPKQGRWAGECPFDLRYVRQKRRQEAWDTLESVLCVLALVFFFVVYMAGYCLFWLAVFLGVLVAIFIFF